MSLLVRCLGEFLLKDGNVPEGWAFFEPHGREIDAKGWNRVRLVEASPSRSSLPRSLVFQCAACGVGSGLFRTVVNALKSTSDWERKRKPR